MFTLYLSNWGYSNGYCGFNEEHGLADALKQVKTYTIIHSIIYLCITYLPCDYTIFK